jgi:MFS transporter, ACS family, glucarate transporter
MSEHARPGHLRWYLVFWLFILSAVSFLDRVNISVAGSSIATEYHLSHIQLGWLFSSFLWGYALFQTLGGWLADRLGPRLVLTAGVGWWDIFTALTATVSPALAGAVFLFVLVRFLLGAGEAIMFPASNLNAAYRKSVDSIAYFLLGSTHQ